MGEVNKLRVSYWDDVNDQEVFGKTYNADWDSEAEEAFYNDPETLNARMTFDGEYPLLVTEE